MLYHYTKNLSSQEVFKTEKPWEFESKAPYDTTDKAEFTSWSVRASTDHMFISAVEGVSPGVTVSKENPARVVWCLVVDYDGIVPDDPVKSVLKKFQGGFLPTWVVLSRSCNAHVVWEFEYPMTICGNDHAKRFMEYVAKTVKASKMFGEMDKKSFDPSQRFEVGREWLRVPGAKPLNSDLLKVWDMDVIKALNAKGLKQGDIIPMEKVAEEAERRWPGRCRRFEVGAHCLRFWDPRSDNENGCMICPDGVRVYVTGPTGGHDAPFRTWEQIFGREFVEESRADRYKDVLSDCFWQSKTKMFWLKNSEGFFTSLPKDSFINFLQTQGFSTKILPGKTSSEAIDTMSFIQLSRGIDSVQNLLFRKNGLIYGPGNDRILNVSKVRPVPPAPPIPSATDAPWNSREARDAFPFIHDVVTRLFQDPDDLAAPVDLQLRYLLAWLAYFYRTSWTNDPGSGQALFLCGGANLGKTFFGRVIVGNLMGGFSEAGNYFMGTAKWNGELSTRGVMVVDDQEASADYKTTQKWQNRIKAFVANGTVQSEAKFENVYTATLQSRLIVTLNDGPAARSIIPPLDNDTRDKISLLLCPTNGFRRPLEARGLTNSDKERMVIEELPRFARWLFEHEVPEDLQGRRFGTVAYCHPELNMSAAMSNYGLEVLEALDIALAGHAEGFEGSAMQLMELLSECCRTLSRSLNVRVLIRTLAALEKDGYDIVIEQFKDTQQYKIPSDIRRKGRAVR